MLTKFLTSQIYNSHCGLNVVLLPDSLVARTRMYPWDQPIEKLAHSLSVSSIASCRVAPQSMVRLIAKITSSARYCFCILSAACIRYLLNSPPFNFENVIIRGCKWNEAVSNRKCNSLLVSNRKCNNLWLLIPSLLSNRRYIVDFVTLEICSAKHIDGSGHSASEIR
jgi:hypothetical protein